MNKLRSLLLAAAVLTAPCALAADRDSDGIDDAEDNCLEIANPSQCDTNGDGIGNHCDADLDNNCIVNSFDLQILRNAFGQTSEHDADLDCNNVVNTFDLGRMRESFGQTPGPSTLWNGCAVTCDPGSSIPMRWVESPRTGQAIAETSQTVRACADGAKMTVSTKGLTPGHAYTMWFGWFEDPTQCKFPPPYAIQDLSCGFLDLYNTAADANFIYGTGDFATGGEVTPDVFEAMVLAGVDPKGTPLTGIGCGGLGEPPCAGCGGENEPPCDCTNGQCKTQWVAFANVDEDTAVLSNPDGAEYHSVFLDHGPKDPDHDDQTTTHDGGCLPGEPYYPCRTKQVSGAVSEIPLECVPLGPNGEITDECLTSLVIGQVDAFVFGKGSGGTDAQAVEIEITGAQRTGDLCTEGIGLCTIKHYAPAGNLLATITGNVECVSNTGPVAYVTGTVSTVISHNEDEPFDDLLNTPFAVTVNDASGASDSLMVNFPDWPVVRQPDLGGVPNLPGNYDPLTGCGCEGGVNTFAVTPENGNFWVGD